MGRNTSISLGNHFEDFIESSLSKGRFSNASEVIRAGLRLLEEEENKISVLKSAIQEGLNSGIATDFNPQKHLESLKSRKRMSKFLLTRKAVHDLEDIWDYTVKKWSENQAEIYYLLLIDSCNEIAKNPLMGKLYDVVEENVLGCKTGEHIIFYRKISEDEVEIIRILHGMMDLKNKF